MGLIPELENKRIFIDSAVFIYYIEEYTKYMKFLDNFFDNLEGGLFTSISSILTLTEVLAAPMKNSDDDLLRN